MKFGNCIFLAAFVLAALAPGCPQAKPASDAAKGDPKAAPADAGKTGADTKPAEAAKSGAPAGGGEKAPAPVKVAAAETKSMPTELENIATVESISTVTVKSQISGQVTEVLFKEGDAVEEGQDLFHIDPRPFEAAIKQLEAKRAHAVSMQAAASAAVVRDKAEAANMRTELGRNKALLDKQMVTQSEYDASRTQAESTQASADATSASAASAADDIRAADADIETAKLNLDYCVIRSPLTGRSGALQIHKGDIVKANDTGAMVTIAQLKPIYVSFTLAEKYLPDVRQRMQEGPVTVTAKAPTDTHAPESGTLTFVDNTVDKMTSTIRLKATFPNDDEYLWPGQYVRAAVQMSVQKDAVVVPSQSVQTGQQGIYVYVVGADMKVELRVVKLGVSKDGFTAIEDGLKAGESVIIDGQLRASPGATVVVVTGEATDSKDGKDKKDTSDGKDNKETKATKVSMNIDVGKNGEDGQDGATGKDGADGQDGADSGDGGGGKGGSHGKGRKYGVGGNGGRGGKSGKHSHGGHGGNGGDGINHGVGGNGGDAGDGGKSTNGGNGGNGGKGINGGRGGNGGKGGAGGDAKTESTNA